MVFHFGMCCEPNSIVSTTRRIDSSGGNRNSFWAMNSLRMSFCRVPASRFRLMPRFSAAAMYMAQITEAGELMVMEVVTWSTGIPSNNTCMSASDETATPHLPNSPSAWGASVS